METIGRILPIPSTDPWKEITTHYKVERDSRGCFWIGYLLYGMFREIQELKKKVKELESK